MRFKSILIGLILAAAFAPPPAGSAQVATRVVMKRGWLGINFDFTSERRDGKVSETMTVLDVVAGSPADKAGVRKGDRIVRIDGKAVSIPRFDAAVRALQPGDTVRLRVATGERERDLTLVAGERPAEFDEDLRDVIILGPDSIKRMTRMFMDDARIKIDSIFSDSMFARFPEFRIRAGRLFGDSLRGGRIEIFRDSLPYAFHFKFDRPEDKFDLPHIEKLVGRTAVAGAEFTELNAGLSQYFGTNKGLLVLRVAPGTPAATAGIEAGDVLLKADGRELETVPQFRSVVLQARDAIRLDVLRKGKTQSLTLELRRRRD